MKLATIRTPEGTRAVRVDGSTLVDLGARRRTRGPRRTTGSSPPRPPTGRRGISPTPTSRPLVPEPEQGRLRGAQLPQPHPGDGPRPA